MSGHAERHYTARVGWLRAAVLGGNDGIVSTASLVIGVAAAGSLTCLAVMGALAARAGGASVWVGAGRVLLWGALAMAATAAAGMLFGTKL